MGKVESHIRKAIDSGKKQKVYDAIKKKSNLKKLEKETDTPDYIKQIFNQSTSEEDSNKSRIKDIKPYKKVTTFDVARQKYNKEESKRMEDKVARISQRTIQEKEKSEYYRKRNVEKGRMLERKKGQPVMKNMINSLLTKIKKNK